MKRIAYQYPAFIEDLRVLAQRIDEPFDAIVAVARGGMTMAHFLGEYWSIRNVFVINSIGYEDTKKVQKPKIFNIPDLLPFQKILIVDDIVDSGETIDAVVRILHNRYPGKVFKTAVLFYKPKKAIVEPTYWLNCIEDVWIDFFWSEDLKLSVHSSY